MSPRSRSVFSSSYLTFGSDFFVELRGDPRAHPRTCRLDLVFLSAYGGMVSLAQLLYTAWLASSSATACRRPSKGLTLGLNPWVAVVAALVITTFVALILGTLSSRTFGIYFLMLTLTYAVIGYYVFGQVATISGFGGITGIDPPSLFDGPAASLLPRTRVLGARLCRVPSDQAHTVRRSARRYPR